MTSGTASLKDSPLAQPGGGLPRSVIRGEFTPQLLVSVDYLNVSFPKGKPQEFVRELAALVGVSGGTNRDRGIHGYTDSVDVGGFGIVGFGGDAQRGTVLVSINGAGCQRVADFRPFVDWCLDRGGRITRLDIAADDHDGESLSVRGSITGWKRGQFDKQGTPCRSQFVSDMGSGRGSTFYVGARLSGKLCRIYEKGKQLGDRASRWVRAEVELHAKDRVIPWEAVRNPVNFLAGAYKFFARFSLVPCGIRTFKRAALVTLDSLTAWAKLACGRTINLLLEKSEGDIGAVVMSLRRPGVPHRYVPYSSPPPAMAAA